MTDLADATGATITSKRFGSTIENFEVSFLGKASSVRIDATSFTIISDAVDKKLLAEKIKNLKEDKKNEPSLNIKAEIADRIAKLSNGIAVMFVAGNFL